MSKCASWIALTSAIMRNDFYNVLSLLSINFSPQSMQIVNHTSGERAVTSSQLELGGTAELLERLHRNIAAAMFGKPELIRLAVVAVLAEGHLLIADMPGVGKTLLAHALARSLECTFHRIQFTPDLLPSDLIGTSVFQQSTGTFVFQPGPLFAHALL